MSIIIIIKHILDILDILCQIHTADATVELSRVGGVHRAL